MIKKIIKTLFGLGIVVGFLLVIGIDRAPGMDPVSCKTLFVQGGIGLLFIVGGFIGLKMMGVARYE